MFRKSVHYMFLLATISVAIWFAVSYGKKDNTFYGDAMGYYMYLPATFIYHNHTDITHFPEDSTLSSSAVYYTRTMELNGVRTPKGYILNQYTYGVALMEMPLFLVAHGYELLAGGKANGYSLSYENAIKASALIYALLGLILIYRILKLYFTRTISLITVIMVFLGTNLFWFTVYQAGMAHVPLFFLYAVLIYLSIRLHKKPGFTIFAVTGLVAGLITVIRPTDILCLLIPLLYHVYSRSTCVAKWQFIRNNKYKVAFMAAMFLLPIIPQLLYWKYLSGQYIYYSYGDQTFHWDHPKVIEGMFYFSNGWLAYSPVMILSLLGFAMHKEIFSWKWCIWVLFPLYIYIAYSWYNYSYINGLGSRPMIHIYPLLSLPMAAFIHYISQKSAIWKSAVTIIAVFCMALNISYSMQRATGMLVSEEANSIFIYRTLFQTKLNYNDLVVYDIGVQQPLEKNLQKTAVLCFKDYEGPADTIAIPDPDNAANHIGYSKEGEYPERIFIKYSKSLFNDAKWMKYKGRFKITVGPMGYAKHMLVAGIKRKQGFIAWWGCKLVNKIGIADSADVESRRSMVISQLQLRKWGTVSYFVPVPDDVQEGDEVMLELWNMGKQEIMFDNISIELYK